MPPKEPTRAQLSSRLAYSQDTPAFLQKLKNKIAGITEDENDDRYFWGEDGVEYEDMGPGREPIPRRPDIPERPDDDPGGSEDEEDGDEKPQVVVLKEGRHLTEREAENIRRKEKGLPPLPEPKATTSVPLNEAKPTKAKAPPPMSFSSSSKKVEKKRKVVGDGSDDDDIKAPSKKKKTKKKNKTLLSFGDEV